MKQVISLVSRDNSGKTFVSACLGMALANLGKKVLLVDLDPQANLSSVFSCPETQYTSHHAMVEAGYFELTKLGEDLFIIPSVPDLIGCELELVVAKEREYILRNFLKQFTSAFDYVIIDTSPGLGLITANALFASDLVIIPVQPEEKMFVPNKHLMEALEKVKAITTLKPITVKFLLNQAGSLIPMDEIKLALKGYYSNDFLKTSVMANYPLNECLHEMMKIKRNPYMHYKASPDIKKLALEIIHLKNQ